MTINPFVTTNIDASWHAPIENSLACMDQAYLKHLATANDWLPGPMNIFNAFSIPINDVRFVLFGESPYPRQASANGYAFWDNAVNELWSQQGLTKAVNRATSLRNFIKMLLLAEGDLSPSNTSQEAITSLDKSKYVQTNQALFGNLLRHGFLLLNASPVLSQRPPKKDAAAWKPFNRSILHCLHKKNPDVCLVLLGRIAIEIEQLISDLPIHKLIAEHPYNLSFISNPKVIHFFKPLRLLAPDCPHH